MCLQVRGTHACWPALQHAPVVAVEASCALFTARAWILLPCASRSFIGQFYSDHDLQEFFGLFFNSSRGQVPKQIGNNDPNNVGMEASLDVQYLMRCGAGPRCCTGRHALLPARRPYPDK